MPVTIKALRKESNGLRNQVDALSKEVKNLHTRIGGKMTKQTYRSSSPSFPVDEAQV